MIHIVLSFFQHQKEHQLGLNQAYLLVHQYSLSWVWPITMNAESKYKGNRGP